MSLFAEVEGSYEGAIHGESCRYRSTYVVRGNRILWTATISRQSAVTRELRGSMFFFDRNASVGDEIRLHVQEAIEKELLREQDDLTIPPPRWVAP